MANVPYKQEPYKRSIYNCLLNEFVTLKKSQSKKYILEIALLVLYELAQRILCKLLRGMDYIVLTPSAIRK